MNMYEVQKNYLKAMKVSNIEQLLPDPKGPNAIKPGPSEKIQIEMMKQQSKQADMQVQTKLALMKLAQAAEKQQAQIHKLEAEAILAVEQAGGIRTGHDIAMLDAQIGAARAKQEGIQDSIKTVMALEKHMSEISSPQPEADMPKEGDVSPK
jgi:urease gamma subunit